MSKYFVHDDELERIRGKVILVTGGAAGIGRSIVDLAQRQGAKVAFCDINEDAGSAVELEYKSDVLFKKCDITNWADVVSFFQCAYNKFGGIDAVVSNAGINKPESFDEPSGGVTTEASKLKPPDISVLRVNVVGTWYVTKCAMHFFGKHSETSSQLVLFGSVASFFDTPPLYTYCSSKGAVMGLMRALRTQVNKQNVTVNMIAPAMTLTSAAPEEVKQLWGDLPTNQPVDVAKASLLPIMRPSVNGKSFIVSGGIITEVEDKLEESQPTWLGPKLDEDMREGQRRLIP